MAGGGEDRIPEEPQRQDRLAREALAKAEDDEEDETRKAHADDRCGEPWKLDPAPRSDEKKCRYGGDQEGCTPVIDLALGAPRRQLAERLVGNEDGGQADRQVDPEHPAPSQMLGEEAAEHRSADARGREHGAEIALVAPAIARSDDVGDGRMRHGDEAAAAETLEGAKNDQLGHGGRERA